MGGVLVDAADAEARAVSVEDGPHGQEEALRGGDEQVVVVDDLGAVDDDLDCAVEQRGEHVLVGGEGAELGGDEPAAELGAVCSEGGADGVGRKIIGALDLLQISGHL